MTRAAKVLSWHAHEVFSPFIREMLELTSKAKNCRGSCNPANLTEQSRSAHRYILRKIFLLKTTNADSNTKCCLRTTNQYGNDERLVELILENNQRFVLSIFNLQCASCCFSKKQRDLQDTLSHRLRAAGGFHMEFLFNVRNTFAKLDIPCLAVTETRNIKFLSF